MRCSYVSSSFLITQKPVGLKQRVCAVTDFIDSLAQSSALWQNKAGNANYCSWAQTFVNSPSTYPKTNKGSGKSVIDRLKSCEPSNSQSVISGGNKMPWLESTANGMKARVSLYRHVFHNLTFS